MSSQSPRVERDSTAFFTPLRDPLADPSQSRNAKLGDMLRQGGPLDSGMRQLGSTLFSGDVDEHANKEVCGEPFDWRRLQKTKVFGPDGESGSAGLPTNLRLKQDKDAGQPHDGGKPGSGLTELREWVAEEGAPKKTDAFSPKLSDGKLEYAKDVRQFERRRTNEWSNEKTGGSTQPDAKTPDATRRNTGFTRDRTTDRTDEPTRKHAPLSAETHYGNYTPDLREGRANDDVKRNTWKSGHEDVNLLNEGNGSSKTNAGLWTVTQETQRGGTAAFGMGMQGEAVDVIKAGPGELTLRANGLFGMETSAGGKFSLSARDVELSAGAELRAGAFGEAGFGYRPGTWEPKLFGVPIDLSPELEGAGRVFAGGELGGGIKAGWRLKTDPATGKTVPEAGIEAKANAFAGGKAEGDASVGVSGLGKVGGSAAALGGVGVEGKASLGVKREPGGHRKLKFELKAGAALGVGASFGVKGEIDLEGLLRFFEGVGKAGKKVVDKVGGAFKGAARKVKDGVTGAAKAIAKTATNAVDKVKSFFSKLF